MSSSRTLLRKLRTSFTCIKPRFDPSIILLYIAASVEQYCDITQVNALPENEGILEPGIDPSSMPSFTSLRPLPPIRSTRSGPSATFSPAIVSKPQPENPLSGFQ